MEPMHGLCGTLEAELSVQRPIKRAELTAFLCLLRKAIGPTVVHVDNAGIIDGLWRGETRCIAPRAKDADLWILIWEEVHRFHQAGILVEVEHVKSAPHRAGNAATCGSSRKCITEGHEKAVELAKEGALLDGGFYGAGKSKHDPAGERRS